MAEYIDREKILEHIKNLPTWWADDKGVHDTKYPKGMFDCEDVVSSIENAPAADVEHVIRCKDCKYWGDEDGIITTDDGIRYARCWFHTYNNDDGGHHGWCPKESDFCSLGELKENGNG